MRDPAGSEMQDHCPFQVLELRQGKHTMKMLPHRRHTFFDIVFYFTECLHHIKLYNDANDKVFICVHHR